MASFTVPHSSIVTWAVSRTCERDRRAYLRIGQDFFNYFNLQEMTQDREFCDKLHASDGDEAYDLITQVTDCSN